MVNHFANQVVDQLDPHFSVVVIHNGTVSEYGPIESDLSITCPRCNQQSAERFYGPCVTCRKHLVEQFRAEGSEVEAPEYEPKMNVNPNAVATKD